MKVLFYSSVNIDYTYHLDHIAKEGETVSSSFLTVGAGGKGANQSAAFAKALGKNAGCKVYLAGKCGDDGKFILDKLNSVGVDTSYMAKGDRTGNAIIQLDKDGKNCIVLFAGGNGEITSEEADKVFENFSAGDMLCINCEINNLKYIVDKAYEKGMKIVLNPSPVNDNLKEIDLSKISSIILNETESRSLTDETDFEKMIVALREKYGFKEIVLTVGEMGSYCYFDGKTFFSPAQKVKVVDTTGAGDTFMGYYFSSRIMGKDPSDALKTASKASSIAVSRAGAMDSVPFFEEI